MHSAYTRPTDVNAGSRLILSADESVRAYLVWRSPAEPLHRHHARYRNGQRLVSARLLFFEWGRMDAVKET